MTDRELLYVKTIAEEHNITRAAQVLYVSQPSLTQSVQRIEKSLGCELFQRRKNGFYLTTQGELYYKAACQILNIWDELNSQLTELSHTNGGVLNIGASWYNTLLILTPVISEYRKRYPRIDVRLTEQKTSELEQMLAKGDVDIILKHRYPAEYCAKEQIQSKKLRETAIIEDRFKIAIHSKYGILADNKEVSPVLPLEALRDIPFIYFSERQRIRHICDYVFEQAGFYPPTAVTTYGFPSALELAASGVGAVMLPEYYLKQEADRQPELQIFSIDDKYHAYWTATVCYYDSDYRSVVIDSFLDCLKQRFSDVP